MKKIMLTAAVLIFATAAMFAQSSSTPPDAKGGAQTPSKIAVSDPGTQKEAAAPAPKTPAKHPAKIGKGKLKGKVHLPKNKAAANPS